MTDTTNAVDPARPPLVAGERAMLDAWLDFHRRILLWKCEGVSPEDLVRRSVEPSTLTLIGLVRHMAEVERIWFRWRLAQEDGLEPLYDYSTDPDADFHDLDPAAVEADLAAYRLEVDKCREVAAGYDLDAVGRTYNGEPVNLRWIYVHMIEEYARHNGHADLIRERIDGATGDWPE
jgi:Protein of unknown function (DUF664)